MPGDAHLTLVVGQDAGENLQQSGFAATVGAHEADDASGGQRQAQIAQGRTPAIGLGQVAHGHQGRGAIQGRNGIEACIGALHIRRRRRQRTAHEGSPDSSVVEAGHRSARVSPA